MEDFEMNFDREIMSYSKNISNVILFAAINSLDDISTFTQREGSNWDHVVVDLFKEFWRFLMSILVNSGQDLTEEDLSFKIKNILMEIENQYTPEKMSKYKIKGTIQNNIYQGFLSNLKKLYVTPEAGSFRIIVNGVILEVQGKYFQMVYKNEFGLRKRIYEPEFAEVLELLVHKSSENLKFLISYYKNEFEVYLRVFLG